MKLLISLFLNKTAFLEYSAILTCLVVTAFIYTFIFKRSYAYFKNRMQLPAIEKINVATGTFIFFILIVVSSAIISIDHPPSIILITVQKLAFVWWLTCIIAYFTQRRIAVLIFTFIFFPILVLQTFGIWHATVMYLDSFSFQINNYSLSVYSVIKTLLVFSLSLWLFKLLLRISQQKLEKLDFLKSGSRTLIFRAQQIFLYFLLFVITLRMLDINLMSITVVGGALGVGIGFGLQKIASNFISGLILVFENSLEVGDLVELSDGMLGFIRSLGSRATLIEAMDGKEVLIPNEEFIVNRVINWTYTNDLARISIEVGVSYNSDLKLVEALLLASAHEYQYTYQDKEILCFLREFGDSSVNFLLTFWIENVSNVPRYQPKSDVMFIIWDKFKQHDIEIPFPQRDINMKTPVELQTKNEL